MIEIIVEDYVVLEDEERNEVTFAVESSLLSEVREHISKMSLFTTQRFTKNNTFLLVNNDTDDEVRFLDVPERVLKQIEEQEEIFIVGVKGQNQIEYYLKVSK